MKFADLHLPRRLRDAAKAGAWLAALACGTAFAATTDISNAPLFTSSTASVKPNIMFILDDSGSMASNFIPDEANQFSMTEYGFRASQCNGLAYNPAVTYSLPVDATGANKTAGTTGFMDPAGQVSNPHNISNFAMSTWPAVGSTFTVTITDGSRQSSWYSTGGNEIVTVYGTASQFFTGIVTSWNTSTGNLGIKVLSAIGSGSVIGNFTNGKVGQGLANTYFTYSGSQPKLVYAYDASANLLTGSTFYTECNSKIGSTPGSGVFTANAVGSASTEAQNYANWNAYYTTRMNMMKTAMSLAFKGVDSRYRVGFSTISARTAVEGTTFLNIRDFDATQKDKFYTDLNAANPAINTPLRGALSKAGQYYANKAPSQTVDPVQYSCQRNFTILSTDGYWNTGYETTTYGPYKLDGTSTVDQQDGGATLRPMFDGGSVTATTTDKWTRTVATATTTDTPRTATTVVTKTSTTTRPVQGQEHFTFNLDQTAFVPASISRPTSTAPFYVAFTTSSPHNLGPAGTTATFTVTQTGGTGVAGYTGTMVVTVFDATTLYYPSTTGTRPSSPSSNSNYLIQPAWGGGQSCTAGKGVPAKQRQTRDSTTSTTVTSTTTTLQVSTLTATVTRSDTTPYTRTTRVVNGVTVSDTTVAGTLQTTTATVTSTAALTPVSTASTGTATTSGFSDWVNVGNPVYTGTCGTTIPADTATTTLAGTTTTVVSTTTAPVTTGPTTTTGTAVVTAGPTTTTTDSAHTVTTVVTTSGGNLNTLADVAMYYYQTDLRDAGLSNCIGALSTDVCANNVPGNTNDAAHSYGDSATWQHMTTFTLGLGSSGLLRYDPNYLTQLSGDYFDITNSSKNWPAPITSTTGGGPANIDDLWHAAVNGRGQYFSAGDPTSLTNSLNSALDSIKAVTGAASAASTSSLQPVQGDNDIYVAQFTTQKWVGDVLSYKIDPTTGQISVTPTWSAKAQLDGQSAASRTIYYAGTSTLHSFTYANLTLDGFNGRFDGFCSKTGADGGSAPAQCATLNATDKAAANLGANLVTYLRGDQSMSYYRSRQNLLGDIINASPLFVGKPGFKYSENAYTTFATTNASRQAVVLAAANDGMLHAFDRVTGDELWAFIPSAVMSNMYKLADNNYSNNHSYFVDGSPQVGDIFVGGAWKTIVVGGLNAGGRSYYALDITNPASPQLLWEYSNNDLGLTFGNPIITKRADGTWVVVFGSGYNNVSPGDGNGHMFVLNAGTGAQITQIPTYSSGTTPVGSSGTPSGLARLNDWVDSEVVNTAKRFYGGDLLGNLWRFDLDNLVAPNGAALRLAQMTSPDGTPQPITVKPAVAEVNYNGTRYPVVYVATGRYLGTTDLSNTKTQSITAMKDPLTATGYGVIRSNSNFVTQTITASGTNRTSTNNTVDWGTKSGWTADLPAGERVSVNPQLALETLYVGSNLPSSDSCTVGGQSFLYQFNIGTGTSTSSYVGNVMIQGLTLVQLTTGASTGSVVTIITRSDGTLQSLVGSPTTTSTNLRRTSWRELVE